MKLEPRIHDNRNDLDYVLTDHYYLPALRLPEDKRPIGRWGRLHKEYLKITALSFINRFFCPGSCIPSWPIWMNRPTNGAA